MNISRYISTRVYPAGIGLILLCLALSGCDLQFGWVVTETPVVTAVPRQTELTLKQSRRFHDYFLHPLYDFECEARVLSARRYYFGRETDLVPVDLALGWRQMSDYNVIRKMRISQFGRWYFYRYEYPPIPVKDIITNSANMHLIPANKRIERAVGKARRGNIVSFTGQLVNVKAEDGWHWNTSTSRTDSGDHACELVFVERFEIKE